MCIVVKLKGLKVAMVSTYLHSIYNQCEDGTDVGFG